MVASRQALCALAAVGILLVAGCSGVGGKQSAPTTIGHPTATTLRGGSGISIPTRPSASRGARVVANPSECPSKSPIGGYSAFSDAPIATLNAAVKGLRRELVPFAAVSVWLCTYDTSNQLFMGSAVLKRAAAVQFERLTNRLPVILGHPEYNGPCRVDDFGFYILTFDVDARRVSIADNACGFWTNGVRFAGGTKKWFNELQGYASRTGPTHPAATGPSNPGRA
jgi:hypothetical protein